MDFSSSVSPVAENISPDSRIYNPAAGSAAQALALSASFSRSFDLPEFDRFQLAASIPVKSSTFGGWISGFGRSLYSERSIGLNASSLVFGSLQAGVGVNCTQISVRNYGNATCYTGDLGFLWRYSGLTLGLSTLNLVSSTLSHFSNNCPAREAHLAAAYDATDRIRLHAELAASGNHDPEFHLGAETRIFPPLAVLIGYESGSERLHIGLALSWDRWMGVGAYDHHPWLGWSHAFGLRWTASPTTR